MIYKLFSFHLVLSPEWRGRRRGEKFTFDWSRSTFSGNKETCISWVIISIACRFVAKWLDHRGLMWPAILERGESPGDRRILVSGNYQVAKHNCHRHVMSGRHMSYSKYGCLRQTTDTTMYFSLAAFLSDAVDHHCPRRTLSWRQTNVYVVARVSHSSIWRTLISPEPLLIFMSLCLYLRESFRKMHL